MDYNNGGLPPPPPLSDRQSWFTYFDADKTGHLTSEEIITGLLHTPDYGASGDDGGIEGVRDLVHAVLPVFDRDGSGTIDRNEFCDGGGMAESLLLAAEQQQKQMQQESNGGGSNENENVHAAGIPTATAVPASGGGIGGAMDAAATGSVPIATATACDYAPQASAPPMPSAPPAPPAVAAAATAAASVASPSGLWECTACSFVNRDCSACKACGRAAPTGSTSSSNASASMQSNPDPIPAAIPPYRPQQQPRPMPQPSTYYQPQSQPQPPTAIEPTTTAASTTAPAKTFRVLIPPGTRPGQQIRVPTGNDQSILVAVPDQRRWCRDSKISNSQPYFDIRVQIPTVAAPDAAGGGDGAMGVGGGIGSSAPPSYGGGGGYTVGSSAGSAATSRPSSNLSGSVAAAAGLASSILAGGGMGASSAAGAHYGHHGRPMSQSMPPSSPYHHQSVAAAAGGGGGNAGSHLAPICPDHVSPTSTTLILKESAMSYSGDDSKIKDVNGNTMFVVRAELMTMSQRRRIYDSRGQCVGQLRRSRLLPSVHIGTPSNEKQCSVVMSGFLNPMNCNANIMLNENRKIGKISGNWRAKKFTIAIDGAVVANVARKKTMQSMFMGADSYCIDVRAGVDLVFISLLAIALDELYHDKKGGMQGGGGMGGGFGHHGGGGYGGLAGSILGPGF